MIRIKRRTVTVVTGLVCSALLLSSFTPASYSGRPASTATTPPDLKTIKLPGEIKLKPEDVVPVDPDRKRLTTVPFTMAEIQPLVAKHVKMVNGVPNITVKNNKLVPLAKYIAELNLWEHYLNTLGYSLRDKALALPRRPGSDPGPIVLPGRRDNFGPILKLRDPIKTATPKPSPRPGDNTTGEIDPNKRTKPPLFDFHIMEDPYAAAINPRIKVQRGEVITSIPRIRSNTQRVQYQVPRMNTLGLRDMRMKRLALPVFGADRLVRALDVPMPCTSKGSSGCPCSWEGPGCKDGVQVSQIDGGQIIDCGTAVVGLGDKPGGGGKPASSTTTTEGDSCGDKTPGDPPCLFASNGSMHAKWAAISKCSLSDTDNDWFSVNLCSEMTFIGDQTSANLSTLTPSRLFLINAGQTHFGFKLFGKRFDLVDATAYAQYKDGQPSNSTKVTVPLLGDNAELPAEGFSGNYEMPPVTIPLAGIVNLKITGGGALSMGFDKTDAPFIKPTESCDSNAENGLLGLNLASHAKANLHLMAALDAVVLSAGIKGELVLADDSSRITMEDIIKVKGNEIVVTPSFFYKIQHMAGHVYVVLTVDVLVYSKTFELEIFSYDGYKPPAIPEVIASRTFSTKGDGGQISRVRHPRFGN